MSVRQEKILEIVKSNSPISGEEIAARLNLSRAALRPYLSVLTMSGILNARPRVGYFYTGRTRETLVAEALKKIKVKDFKSRPVVIKESASVYDAVVALFLEDIGTLFVVREGGILKGVVSRKDLLKSALGGLEFYKVPVTVVMTRMPNIITTTFEENILEVAHKIMEYEIDALPVVKELTPGELEVVGRVSKTNIARVMVELGGKI